MGGIDVGVGKEKRMMTMKKITLLLLTLAFITSSCNRQVEKYLCTNSLTLFTLINPNWWFWNWEADNYVERNSFVSLSAIDRFIDDPDLWAVPTEFVSRIDWRGRHITELSLEEWRILLDEWAERSFFRLDTEYRKRFLERTGISETDSVFVYDFAKNVLRVFQVKELNVAAALVPPSKHWEYPYYQGQHNYRIGFEIDDADLNEFCWYSEAENIVVYVGKKNPFVMGQMREIRWRNIPSEDFPLEKSNLQPEDIIVPHLMEYLTRRDTFLYESEDFMVFLQDLFFRSLKRARHLLIIDKETENVLVERVFRSNEGWNDFEPPVAFKFLGLDRYHFRIRFNP